MPLRARTAIGEWFATAVRDDLSCGAGSEAVPPYGRLWHLDGYGFRRCEGIHCHSTGELDRLTFEAVLLGPTRGGVILQAEPGAHPSSTP